MIKPLTRKCSKVAEFATSDLETMEINGKKVPVLITFSNGKFNRHFIIDSKVMKSDINLALSNLWGRYFYFLKANSIETVFFHNLGSFDGYFLFKGLSNYAKHPSDVSTIVNDSNKFIVIGLDEIHDL